MCTRPWNDFMSTWFRHKYFFSSVLSAQPLEGNAACDKARDSFFVVVVLVVALSERTRKRQGERRGSPLPWEQLHLFSQCHRVPPQLVKLHTWAGSHLAWEHKRSRPSQTEYAERQTTTKKSHFCSVKGFNTTLPCNENSQCLLCHLLKNSPIRLFCAHPKEMGHLVPSWC